MLDVINAIEDDQVKRIMSDKQDLFCILLGMHPIDALLEDMLKIWSISSITGIYKREIGQR